MPQAKLIFDKAAAEIIAEIRANMVSEGVNATGKTSQSLEAKTTDSTMIILGRKSFTWVEQGRRPGTPPPFSPILEWVEAKGIGGNNPVAMAWRVVNKIAKSGSVTFSGADRRKIFTDLITDQRVDSIVSQVQVVKVYEVEREIFNPLGNMFASSLFNNTTTPT